MGNYAMSSEFKKITLLIIAHKSDSRDIWKLRHTFESFKSANKGRISFQEFKNAFSHYNYSDEDLLYMFEKADMFHDGYINYTEFIAATLGTQGTIDEHRILGAFEHFDRDNKGYITKQNLMNVLGNSSKELIDIILQDADIDKCGVIYFQEFLKRFRDEHQKVIESSITISSTEEPSILKDIPLAIDKLKSSMETSRLDDSLILS